MENKLPNKEQLKAAITQMILQRSQMKDQIEQIERQLPVLQGQLQLLNAQHEAETAKVATID